MKPGLRLGIDLGGTQIKMALVSARGDVEALQKIDTPRKPAEVVARLLEALRNWKKHRVAGTGVGVAGDIDPEKGIVRYSPNLGWQNVPLKKLFQRAGFPKPLYFDNDATATAWGVYCAELKRRSKNLLVLTIGTGVGGGIVMGGRLHRGATGTAGEIGHMTIHPDGPVCSCGNRGCLEAYLGGSHIVKRAREAAKRRRTALPPSLTAYDLYKMARKRDPLARAVWHQAGWALGMGLSSLINIFNPDTVVLCGGVARASSVYLHHARRIIKRRAFRTPRSAVRILTAGDSHSLGVIGSAFLVP